MQAHVHACLHEDLHAHVHVKQTHRRVHAMMANCRHMHELSEMRGENRELRRQLASGADVVSALNEQVIHMRSLVHVRAHAHMHSRKCVCAGMSIVQW